MPNLSARSVFSPHLPALPALPRPQVALAQGPAAQTLPCRLVLQGAAQLLLMLWGLAGTPALAAEFAQRVTSQQHTPATAAAPVSMPLSKDVREVLDWVRQSGDNLRLPFVLVDKRSAAVHVFDAAGVLQASSAALLGVARGDHSVPGIGERPMSQIAPHERTTPAGRFVSEPGHNLKGEDIVWVDYDVAVSLHRVRPSVQAERRLQRLASRSVDEKRISFGCINLPVSFYNRFVAPTLGQQAGVVYILPETQPAAEFFGFAPESATPGPRSRQ